MRFVPGVLAAVSSVGLSLTAFLVIARWEDRLAEQEFAAHAGNHALILQNGISQHLGDVTALRALLESDERGIRRSEFAKFNEFLLRDHPAMYATSWIPRVMHEEREAHQLQAVIEGLSNYFVKTPASEGRFVPAAAASEYFPMFYSSREPLDSPVYGLNLNDGGLRQQTLERARDTDQLAVSRVFDLQVDEGDRSRFFAVLPVYRFGIPHGTLEERRRNLVGFVQGVFRVGKMVESVLHSMSMPAGMDIYFYTADVGPDTLPTYFHPSRERADAPAPLPHGMLAAGTHWSSPLRIGDRQWTYVAAPIPGGIGIANHARSSTVLVAGLLLSALLVAYLISSGRQTRSLSAANCRLDEANASLDAANAQLLAQNARFDTALNNMSQGLVMYDATERLVVCNDRFIAMYGLSRNAVKPGVSLLDMLRRRADAGLLDEDPEQFRRKLLAHIAKGITWNSIIATPDGREISITSTPMAGGGWVVTHEHVTERRLAEARIAFMAHHDALTGLPNRLTFHQRLGEALATAKAGEHPAVLCLDLDYFKAVNDTLGHPVGDELLKLAADRIRECVADTDVVARLGGDEFAIVQKVATQPTDATALASRLIDSISAPCQLDGHQVVVGLSIGIAVAPIDGLDADLLLKNADMALYRAKADGRRIYRFFEPEMDARMQARRTLELDLRKAIAEGEFELYFQPLVDLKTERVSGFEALIRWHHPRRGMVSPVEFIPLAEETGLIVPLGDWVLREACRQAATWPDDIKVAVNLSPAQFKSRALLPGIMSALAASGLSATRLELEITESVLLHDSDATLALLHTLRDIGLRISMDDFGTGYSSLSYLRKFPFDKIKIDRSFIRDLGNHDDSIAIVRAVAAMGTSLGISTTAEGVETAEQFERLKLEGCTEVQGYLFSPPRPASEVANILATLGHKRQVAA